MKKIVVFGVGAVAGFAYEKIDLDAIEILGFVNPYTFCADKVKEFRGYPVLGIEKIKGLEYDYLLIASGNVSDVKHKIIEIGLDITKAVAFVVDSSNDVFFTHLGKDINQQYAAFLNDKNMQEIIPSYKRNDLFPVTMQFSSSEKIKDTRDFVRYKQLELIAQRIYERNIEGCVAECGVYKGEFSKKINEFFPDRKLYLFDTFEGFDNRNIKAESTGGG